MAMTLEELKAKWPRAQFEEFKVKGHFHPSDTYEEYLDMRREQEEIAEEGRRLGLTGDEPPELTEEDEAILDRIWEEMGREDKLRCGAKCPGVPELSYVTRTFERRGSPVKVTIHNIPASVCPLCHKTYVSDETSRQIDFLLEPFYGRGEYAPALPPAEVIIDFAEATAALKAA
jgi:hypothetical protein